MTLRPVAPGLHVHERPLRFFGLEIGTRMTVVSLADGLLLYSPTDAPVADVAALGNVRWVLAPNRMHHLYAGPWIERGAEGWAAPGLPEKRSDLTFAGVIEEEGTPFGDEVLAIPMRCFSLTREVVVLHRPSRTLIVTDLVFNFQPDAPWLTRTAMCCALAYPGVQTSLLERVGMHRATARAEIARLLELDFDRLIPTHGAIVDTGGREALAHAFRWLSPV